MKESRERRMREFERRNFVIITAKKIKVKKNKTNKKLVNPCYIYDVLLSTYKMCFIRKFLLGSVLRVCVYISAGV